MIFRDLPVVFLSYREDNADDNFEHLKTMVPRALRVHGVKGFDAAHKAAANEARLFAQRSGIDLQQNPFFITVDGDNTTLPNFWKLDTEQMFFSVFGRKDGPGRPAASVLSWNSYNPVTGLAYGNGGLKLWGYQFVDEMTTHEQSTEDVVDFCWNMGYRQLAPIFSITNINGSPRQAFTAGFREGAKMPLVGGKSTDSIYETNRTTYPTNLERLITWCSVGAHAHYGNWSMFGAVKGFYMCHVTREFDLKNVSDLDLIHSIYEQTAGYERWSAEMDKMRLEIKRVTDLDLPNFGAKQSAFIVSRTMPHVSHAQHPFEAETWSPKLELNQ
jgi:hypothetical protein